MDLTYHLVGQELVYGKPHRFAVSLRLIGHYRFAWFMTNDKVTACIRITRTQWDAFLQRHRKAA